MPTTWHPCLEEGFASIDGEGRFLDLALRGEASSEERLTPAVNTHTRGTGIQVPRV